jgi:hypothetical protein
MPKHKLPKVSVRKIRLVVWYIVMSQTDVTTTMYIINTESNIRKSIIATALWNDYFNLQICLYFEHG